MQEKHSPFLTVPRSLFKTPVQNNFFYPFHDKQITSDSYLDSSCVSVYVLNIRKKVNWTDIGY